MEFEFFYDVGSPYSYLASTQLAGLQERTSTRARLYPITLGGLRKVIGTQGPPTSQLSYMAQDTQRWAKRYGVPLTIPQPFPTSTIKALRACVAADREGKQERAMHALFRAHWADGKDISNPVVIEHALSLAGLDGRRLVDRAEEQEIKDLLRRNTDLALARGVFGVPTIFVGDRNFWGNDRLEFAEAALHEARRLRSARI